MTWTIDNHAQGPLAVVMVGRADKRHGIKWRNHPHGKVTRQSMARLCRVAQKYATRVRLHSNGWEASGEDGALR